MHKILLLETMEIRNHTLNHKFINKISSKLITKNIASQIIHANRKLARKNKYIPQNWVEKKEENQAQLDFKSIKIDHLKDLDKGLDNVAGILNIESFNAFKLPYEIPKKYRIAIIRWIVGTVCTHQKCLHCNLTEVSRVHGMQCSGAEDFLKNIFPNMAPPRINSARDLTITKIINNFEDVKGNPHIYKHLFEAISMIYIKCLKYKISDSGFWQRDQDQRPNINPNDVRVPTHKTKAILRTQRPRQLTRKLGRPRSGPKNGIG
jgi:hypothetical protein